MNEIVKGALTATTFIVVVISISTIVGFVLYKIGLFTDLKKEKDRKKRFGRMLAIVIGIAMILLGIGKLVQFQPQIQRFDEYYQMLHMVNVVGIAELTIGLLLLFRNTFKLGVLLLHVSLGGSMVVHFPEFSDGVGAAIGSVWVLILLWISTIYYTPEMFPEFINKYFNK